MAAFLLGSVLSAIVRKSSRVSKIHNNDISSLTGSEIITNRAVVPPDGFSISPRTVSASVEERFMKWMSDVAPPWERSIEGRQVLQYGPARFDYGLQTVLPSPHAPPIPVAIVDMFFGYIPAGVRNGLSQCIINEYRAGDSIPFHTDDVLFGEDIFVFCLGEARPLLLRRPLRAISAVDGSGVMDALTEEGTIYEYWQVDAAATVRGMYHLCGPARYAWQHAVPAAPSSAPAHKARYSVTFRSVL